MDPKRIVREGYDTLGDAYRPATDEPHATSMRSWFLGETLIDWPLPAPQR